MLQVIENDVENTYDYSQKYKSEYKNKKTQNIAVQFVQTCLPEVKLLGHQLVSLAEETKNIFRGTLRMTNLHH